MCSCLFHSTRAVFGEFSVPWIPVRRYHGPLQRFGGRRVLAHQRFWNADLLFRLGNEPFDVYCHHHSNTNTLGVAITEIYGSPAGILIGPLSQRFSLRPVLLVGTLCSALGFIVSSFARNTTVLTFTYGVLGGFGVGAIQLLVNVLMTQYFEQYRGMAIGEFHELDVYFLR